VNPEGILECIYTTNIIEGFQPNEKRSLKERFIYKLNVIAWINLTGYKKYKFKMLTITQEMECLGITIKDHSEDIMKPALYVYHKKMRSFISKIEPHDLFCQT